LGAARDLLGELRDGKSEQSETEETKKLPSGGNAKTVAVGKSTKAKVINNTTKATEEAKPIE
jgi:pantothenate kinase